MADALSTVMQRPGYRSGGYLLFGATGVILAALAFEHYGGYAPCPLCLVQRYAYYAAIPLAFLGLILIGANRLATAGILFLIAGLAFAANAFLGGYHAGIEWGWWPGPTTCAQPAAELGGSGGLLNALQNNSVVSCSEAGFRALGLSFAGWNAVISAALAACGLFAANQTLDLPPEAV